MHYLPKSAFSANRNKWTVPVDGSDYVKAADNDERRSPNTVILEFWKSNVAQ